MLVSILTPTYNRAYIIKKLYKSLLQQTDKNFEWIVIDDGSTDNTKNMLENIIKETKIKITYFQKENGGKHTALNKGIKKANGEIVVIVDSDDYLVTNAVQRIREESKKIINNNELAGVVFRKVRITNNEIIGSKDSNNIFIDTDLITYRYKNKIKGDLMECFKLKILKEYPFPIYKNEKFVPEALVWNRISQKYKMRIFNNEGIYMCEYLPDGYSQQFKKLREENKKAYIDYYYEELTNKRIPLKRKVECLVRLLEMLIMK